MTSKRKYFALGIFRIAIATIVIAAIMLILNIYGYYTLPYTFDGWYRTGLATGDTYIGRALGLVVIGAGNAFLTVFAMVALYLVLEFAVTLLKEAYKGILYIGGYREQGKNNDDI